MCPGYYGPFNVVMLVSPCIKWEGGTHYCIAKRINHCPPVPSRLPYVALPTGGGETQVGSHGLSEQLARDECLRRWRSQQPGTTGLVRLWKNPDRSCSLVVMLRQSLRQNLSPQSLLLLCDPIPCAAIQPPLPHPLHRGGQGPLQLLP